MTTHDRGMRIALVGHYGAGNIGDEATIEALIEALRDRLPDATIVGVSANPADTRRRHGIDLTLVTSLVQVEHFHPRVSLSPTDVLVRPAQRLTRGRRRGPHRRPPYA